MTYKTVRQKTSAPREESSVRIFDQHTAVKRDSDPPNQSPIPAVQASVSRSNMSHNLAHLPLSDRQDSHHLSVATQPPRHPLRQSVTNTQVNPALQRMKRKNKDNFIVDDEESDGEADYVDNGDDGREEWLEYHESDYFDSRVPKNKWQRRLVNGRWYQFYNEGDGTLDFLAPKQNHPVCPIYEDINILGTPNFPTAASLRTPRGNNSLHFTAANDEAGTQGERGAGSSPAGRTWHHHKDVGRMQLLNRRVHAAFKHCGGKAIWGTQ